MVISLQWPIVPFAYFALLKSIIAATVRWPSNNVFLFFVLNILPVPFEWIIKLASNAHHLSDNIPLVRSTSNAGVDNNGMLLLLSLLLLLLWLSATARRLLIDPDESSYSTFDATLTSIA